MKTKIFLLVTASIFIFFSCSPKTETIQMNSDNESDVDVIQIDNPGTTKEGTLEIRLSDEDGEETNLLNNSIITKTVMPQIDMTRDTFRITAACSDGSSFRLTTKLSSIQILGMPVGTWTIRVESINRDKISIGYGRGDVEIKESETSALTVNVAPYAGFGLMEVTVNWEAGLQSPILKGSLSQSNGPSYDLSFEISGNSARAIITGAAGYYILRLNLYDAVGTMYSYVGGAVEIIRIIENETTPGVYTILANSEYGSGNVQIGINVDMKDPIEIQLIGQNASLNEGQTMTVTATSPLETGTVNYTWYLNGEHVGDGNLFATKASLPAGNYRLDVTAFNDTGDRGGSVSYLFVVRTSPPANLIYSQNPVVYTGGLPIQANTVSVTGSGITFNISPALPTGLSLDAHSGTISGTPTAAQSATIYTVYATNSGGSTSVSLSITVNVVVPVLAVVGVGNDHVDLSWTYNFPNIDGYAIYRSTTSGSYNYSNPLAIVSTSNGTYTYTDATANSNTTYYYIVRAFSGSVFSQNSNEVIASTTGEYSSYLTGHWKLDGNLLDSAGTNNGAAYGSPLPVYTAGPDGLSNMATKFIAANANYVSFGNSLFGMDTTNQFTVAFWVRLDGSTINGIVARSQYAYPFSIRGYSANRLQWIIRTNDTHYYVSNGGLTTNSWYYVTINYGNGYSSIYINGVKDKSEPLAGDLMLGWGDDNLILGNNSDVTMSDLSIYNTCLTDTEVAVLYTTAVGNTVYSCVRPTGYTLTAAEQAKYGSKVYGSLSQWNSAEATNLVSADKRHICEIIGGSLWDSVNDTTAVNIGAGWTTDATHNITVTALGAARCSITRGKGYRLVASAGGGAAISLVANYTVLSGVGARNTSTSATSAFLCRTGCVFIDCMAYDTNAGPYPYSMGFNDYAGSGTNYFINCIAYNCRYGFVMMYSNWYAYNCLSLNALDGGFIAYNGSGAHTLYGKNCYSGGSGVYDYYSDGIGIFSLTTCRSNDGTQGTTIVARSTSSGAYFSNVTAGSENCTIGTSSQLKDAGTDLSADSVYPFNYDFIGTIRTGSWDIGAFEAY